jgi:hypothetical protein
MRRTSAALTLVALATLACSKGDQPSDTAAATPSDTAATATPPAGTATGAAAGGDADRTVAGGGISVAGWQGKTDKGTPVTDSRFASANGGGIDIKTGAAGIFWNPQNTASGNYEVKSTFTEHKQNADHPHAYGVFIGGSDLDSANQAYAYCIAYGDGSYSVNYFNGAKVTKVVSREQSPAVKKADASGVVTNEVGWRVRNNTASCVINGQEVKSWPASQLTGAGKLKSLDGTYGVRVSHNIDVSMTPLTMTKL